MYWNLSQKNCKHPQILLYMLYLNRDLVLVPQSAPMQYMTKRQVFIPNGNQCCEDDVINKLFNADDFDAVKGNSNWSILKSSELNDIMKSCSAERVLDEQLV